MRIAHEPLRTFWCRRSSSMIPAPFITTFMEFPMRNTNYSSLRSELQAGIQAAVSHLRSGRTTNNSTHLPCTRWMTKAGFTQLLILNRDFSGTSQNIEITNSFNVSWPRERQRILIVSFHFFGGILPSGTTLDATEVEKSGLTISTKFSMHRTTGILKKNSIWWPITYSKPLCSHHGSSTRRTGCTGVVWQRQGSRAAYAVLHDSGQSPSVLVGTGFCSSPQSKTGLCGDGALVSA